MIVLSDFVNAGTSPLLLIHLRGAAGDFEDKLAVYVSVHLYELGDEARPARLVASTDARAVVPMKIFVE